MLWLASKVPGHGRVWLTTCALAALTISPAFAQAAKKKTPATSSTPASTSARVQKTGTLKLGYRADARPFSFKDETGKPAGYSVELCQQLAATLKSDLNLPNLQVEWIEVPVGDRLEAIQQHQIDVMCGAMSLTLERRKEVDFSSSIFPGGVGVVVRSDAPNQFRNILAGKAQKYTPTWRAVALNIVREQTFATLPGTTAEQWVKQRAKDFEIEVHQTTVPDYQAGLQAVKDRQVSAFFAERAILLDAVRNNKAYKDLTVIDRQFTYEPLALAVERGDDDFRLLVDAGLSRFYNSSDFATLYTKWFGEPDDQTVTFFRWNALPN